MLKLEKIIILFKLFYLFKKSNLRIGKSNFLKVKVVKLSSCSLNFSYKFCYILFNKINWFLYNFNFYKKIKKYRSVYLCIKKYRFSLAFYIYFKNKLLLSFNEVKKVKKKWRKLEKLKKKGLIKEKKKFVYKRRVSRKLLKKRLLKRYKINIFFKWLLNIILKLVIKFKISFLNICIFKSKNLIFKRRRKTSTRKLRIYRRKFFKLIKNLFLILNLNKIKNFKVQFINSNLVSHSRKNLLKLKKKRS